MHKRILSFQAMLPMTCILVGCFFLYAALDKLLHFGSFLNALATYPIIPLDVGRVLGLPIVAAELYVGAALLIPRTRTYASLYAAALLATFAGVLASSYFLNPLLICGCWFSLTLAESTPLHIGQNIVLAAVMFSVWRTREQSTKTNTWLRTVAQPTMPRPQLGVEHHKLLGGYDEEDT